MRVDTTNQYEEYIEKYLNVKDKSILDIGCGKGTITKYFIKNNKVTAIDPEKKNIMFIKREYPKINAFVGFGEKLKFEDNSFDIVIFSLSFHHIPIEKMNTALKEAHRVLKKDGIIVFFEIGSKGSFIECELLYYDESKEKSEAYQRIKKNIYFNINTEKAFMVNWEWNNYQDFFTSEINDSSLKFDEKNLKQKLNMNITNGKIILDIETIILIGTKR